MASFQRIARGYRNFALYFLNTVLMSAVAAGGYFLVLRFRQSKPTENPLTKYGIAQLLPVYPGRSQDEIAGIFQEAYSRPLIYEPFTHFRELPATGRFVNVTKAGFRLIEDAPQYSSQFMGMINQSLHERKGIEGATATELVSYYPRTEPGTAVERAQGMCERYLRNKGIIAGMAKARGTKTVFVWQPVPAYKFDLKLHPFSKSATFPEHLFPGVGHGQMARIRQTNAEAAEVLWLADMQENAHEQLYVDAVHYSAKMCGQIAAEIARFMREQSVVPQR